MYMQIPSAVNLGENVGQLGNEKIVCECVVCLLIIKGFPSLNFADKLQLITEC